MRENIWRHSSPVVLDRYLIKTRRVSFDNDTCGVGIIAVRNQFTQSRPGLPVNTVRNASNNLLVCLKRGLNNVIPIFAAPNLFSELFFVRLFLLNDFNRHATA